MKKSHGFLAVALICASPAFAGNTVTPVLMQEAQRPAPRDPEIERACAKHLTYSTDLDKIVNSVNNEACKPAVAFLLSSIEAGKEACIKSNNPSVREMWDVSLRKATQEQNLACTREEAFAQCRQCLDIMKDVIPVENFMTTEEIKDSLNIYKNVIDQAVEISHQKGSCDLAKSFDLTLFAKQLAELETELKNSQRKEVRYVLNTPDFKLREIRAQVQLRKAQPRAIERIRTELAPVGISAESSAPADDAGVAMKGARAEEAKTDSSKTDSSKSDRKPPSPQVAVVEGLSNGGTGFAFLDPAHPWKNMVGYTIEDPETGETKVFAYPTTPEKAAAMATAAVAKDPNPCDQILKEAQASEASLGHTEEDALKLGKSLIASLSRPAPDQFPMPELRVANTPENGIRLFADENNHNDDPEKDLRIGSGLGSGMGLKSRGTRFRAQSNTQSPESTPDSDSQNSQTDQVASRSKKKAKPRSVASSKKPEAKKLEAKKPAAKKPHAKKSHGSSSSYFTSEDVSSARYFVVAIPPRFPYVGRVAQVNGKTQIVYYQISANAAQLKEMAHNPAKVKAAFEEQNSSNAVGSHSLFMNPGADNQLIRETLLKQAFKQ